MKKNEKKYRIDVSDMVKDKTKIKCVQRYAPDDFEAERGEKITDLSVADNNIANNWPVAYTSFGGQYYIPPIQVSSSVIEGFYSVGVEAAKQQIKTEKEEKRIQNRLNEYYQKAVIKQEVNSVYNDREKLKSYDVFLKNHHFMISISAPGKVLGKHRKLILEELISAKKCTEDKPQGTAIMAITFKHFGKEKKLEYDPSKMVEKPGSFITFLRKAGLGVEASERAGADIGIALLRCIDEIAEDVLVEAGNGYYKNRAGKWILATAESTKSINWKMNDNQKKMAIILLAAAAFPVLISWKVQASQPIIIFVSSGMANIAEQMTGNSSYVYTATSKKREILNGLTKSKMEPQCFLCDGSFRSDERAKEISNTLKVVRVYDKPVLRLPLFLAEDISRVPNVKDCLVIPVNGDMYNDIQIRSFLPEPDDFSLIKEAVDDINNKTDYEYGEIGKFLHAALCFLKPKCKANGQEKFLDDLHTFLDSILELNAQTEDMSDLSKLFIDELFAYCEEEKNIKFIDLNDGKTDAYSKRDSSIFYDSEYIFLSTSMFDTVCKRLKHIAVSGTFKSALAEEGILVTLKTGYTSRMSIKDESGKVQRPRMLKFVRDEFVNFEGLNIVNI